MSDRVTSRATAGDTRERFTVVEDRDLPPDPKRVVRVKTCGLPVTINERGRVVPDRSAERELATVRVYLRDRAGGWLREDEVELDTTQDGRDALLGVRRTWTQLLDHEQLLIAEPRITDADFAGVSEPDLGWTMLEAEGLFSAALRDIEHHNCADGEWGDFAELGPAGRLAMLDTAMDKIRAAIGDANDRLRTIRLQIATAANRRWRDDLAALHARIRQAHQNVDEQY